MDDAWRISLFSVNAEVNMPLAGSGSCIHQLMQYWGKIEAYDIPFEFLYLADVCYAFSSVARLF